MYDYAGSPPRLGDFVHGGELNLKEFIARSFAELRGGNRRFFNIDEGAGIFKASYYCGTRLSKGFTFQNTIRVDADFYVLMGLLQADAVKSNAKYFCFTSKAPDNIAFVARQLKKYAPSGKLIFEIAMPVGTEKKADEIKRYWAEQLSLLPENLRAYLKRSNHISDKSDNGVMNLRVDNKAFSQVFLRLLETTKAELLRGSFLAGYFISGVLAGDGFVGKSKKGGSLNYVAICFDASKVLKPSADELSAYIAGLDAMGIKRSDLAIYLNANSRIGEIAEKIRRYGIRVKVHSTREHNFGATLMIFKYRNFLNLAKFNAFLPNAANYYNFKTSLSAIDPRRAEKN